MSATKIIKAFAKKSLTKDKGSGIISLPGDFMAAEKAAQIEFLLSRAGIPLEQLDDYIRSEADLLKFLNIIEAINKPKVYSGQAAADQLNKLFPKKGEVVKFPQKRTFAEEIETMKKSGDLVDEKDMVISEKITNREMFKDANKRFNTKEIKEAIDNASPGFAGDRKYDAQLVAEDLAEKRFGKEFYDLDQKQQIDLYDEAYQGLTKQKFDPPEDLAKGGRAGHYTGGMVDVEPSLSDIGHGSDALMARTRLVSPGSQTTTSTGLNYLLAEDNDNIRVPFAGGGSDRMKSIAEKEFETYNKIRNFFNRENFLKKRREEIEQDRRRLEEEKYGVAVAEGGRIGFQGGGMGRRAFLKLLAALTGGVAAAKSGILSLGGKEAGKKAVTETVKKAAGSGQPPPYFFELMETITKNGKEIKSYGERVKQTVAPSKDGKSELLLTEDLNTGSVQIKKIHKEGDDMITKSEEMTYTKNMGDESTQGKPPDDYEEVTAFNSRIYKDEFNEPDFVDGIDVESILKEVDVKKADGGRIDFSAGGLANVLSRLGIKGSSRRFLEKAFGKENFENMIRNDPEMHRGLLEVVEMFRNRDKEGLKMYMQKFLPHMDDAEVEQFIIGSTPDIEGLTGQLTRLGSGRDYKGKLEMMKKADEVKKLENFDIKNVTKNAEGGRIELKGGGDALKALLNYFAKEAGKKGSDQLRDINPKALGSGIANIMGPEHLKMLRNNQTDYLEHLLNVIKSDKKFLDQNKKLAETMMKDAPEGFEDQAQGIVKMMIEGSMGKGGRLDRLKVYDKIDIDDAIVDVEQMIKNRRVKESDGRALNASGGLQAMLGE